jgi:hypothetical protein
VLDGSARVGHARRDVIVRTARRFVAAGALAWLAACNRGSASAEPPAAPPDPFAQVPYASAPLPPEAKVFLVAGGDDVGNFAAEVVEQRAMWKRAGLRDEEIACYYAKPSRRALAEDGEQLTTLAPALRGCYAADPATLHAHLRQAARTAPPFVYLYVTSHGLPPLLRWKAGVEDANALPKHLELRPGEVGRFDRHVIALQGGDGPELADVAAILAAHRGGAAVESLVFTPDTLADALAELPKTSEAIVVLQACFAGGFIGRPDDDGPSPLTKLPRVTMLAATSAEQPSFGCDAGSTRTYWGGALNRVLGQALEQQPGPPPTLPWAEIHARVRFVVETMELIEGEEPSEPSFFTNAPAPAETKK